MSRVFIGSLPYDVREKDIENFLRGKGRIREISLKKGYGFVVRVTLELAALSSDSQDACALW